MTVEMYSTLFPRMNASPYLFLSCPLTYSCETRRGMDRRIDDVDLGLAGCPEMGGGRWEGRRGRVDAGVEGREMAVELERGA